MPSTSFGLNTIFSQPFSIQEQAIKAQKEKEFLVKNAKKDKIKTKNTLSTGELKRKRKNEDILEGDLYSCKYCEHK